jgi:hypothetical protein
MSQCEKLIKADIVQDCESPIVSGLEPDGIIINREDIDFGETVFDQVNKNIIKTLILKTGKKGFNVVQTGNTPFSGAKTDMVVGTYRNKFTNEIPIAVLDNGPDVCEKVIDGLANGTFVLILKNRHKGTDGKAEYQVYGYYQGLKASALTNEKYSEDTDGGWLITLQEVGAPKSALFYFNTDSATTETQFEALKTAAV